MTRGLQNDGSLAVDHSSAGGGLVSVDGLTLTLKGIALRGEGSGGLAHIVVEQRFQNPHPDPPRVTYQMPVPSDAAVSGYAFQIGPSRIAREVDRVTAARAGRAGEIVMDLDEDPTAAITRLLTRLEAPLLSEVTIAGSALRDQAPAWPPAVRVAAPLLVALRLRPEGATCE